jgi:hypothetical protein
VAGALVAAEPDTGIRRIAPILDAIRDFAAESGIAVVPKVTFSMEA